MTVQLTISGLNDLLRSTFLTGRVVMTEGVRTLPIATQAEIVGKVRSYDAFCPKNDPHGEHDYGSFDQADAGRIIWKIDYYNCALDGGSDDPADPKRTSRGGRHFQLQCHAADRAETWPNWRARLHRLPHRRQMVPGIS